MWRMAEFPLSWKGVNHTTWDCLQVIDKTDKMHNGDRNQVWLSASIMMYSLWFARNSARMKRKQLVPNGFLALVRNIKCKWVCPTDYSDTEAVAEEQIHTGQIGKQKLQSLVQFSQEKERWYMDRPPPDWVILLTDATYSPEDGTTTFGAVLVDYSGTVIGTKAKFYAKEILHGAEEAELLAVEHGTEWATTLHLSNLIIFSDCSNVIEVLLQKREVIWQLQPILHHILNDKSKQLQLHPQKAESVSPFRGKA